MSADPKELEKRMQGAMDALKKELGGLRTGRASVNLLEPVVVEAYGQRMQLNQVGTVSAPEPRLLTVNVWDKGLVVATAKAIRGQMARAAPQIDVCRHAASLVAHRVARMCRTCRSSHVAKLRQAPVHCNSTRPARHAQQACKLR